jgi:hypothetical protein
MNTLPAILKALLQNCNEHDASTIWKYLHSRNNRYADEAVEAMLEAIEEKYPEFPQELYRRP